MVPGSEPFKMRETIRKRILPSGNQHAERWLGFLNLWTFRQVDSPSTKPPTLADFSALVEGYGAFKRVLCFVLVESPDTVYATPSWNTESARGGQIAAEPLPVLLLLVTRILLSVVDAATVHVVIDVTRRISRPNVRFDLYFCRWLLGFSAQGFPVMSGHHNRCGQFRGGVAPAEPARQNLQDRLERSVA